MDKLRPWIALAGVAVVAVLAGGWFLLVTPQRTQAADLRTQVAAQQQTVQQTRTQLRLLQSQAADLPRQQAALTAVATKLPFTADQSGLLRALEGAARTAGVEFVSLAPGAPVPVAGAAATPTAGGAAGTLMSLPLTISVAGGYYQVEQYLAALEALPRAVRVTNLAIVDGADPVQSGPGTTRVDDGKHLVSTLTGTVYFASGAAPLTPVTAPSARAAK